MTFTTRPTLRGTFGMVSSTHWLASQSAMRILELGGNAFDAGAAAGFVLHVVEPHLNGPGGEVPAIIATADDPTPRVLCGQGVGPAGAPHEHNQTLRLMLVPGSGPLAATVPGAVDAWLLLLRDHGTLPLSVVLEPAIDYARNGHPLVPRIADTIGTVQRLFEDHWPTSAALWLKNGSPVTGRFSNEAYAATLEKLVEEAEAAGADRQAQIERARKTWREGFVAEAIDKFSRLPPRDSSGDDHAGLITGDDLAGFEATWEDAATYNWNGYTVAKTGPWGQGPALLQSLAVLAELGDVDLDSAEGVHTTVEVMKLSYADREAWYGDGADVPLDTLLSLRRRASEADRIGRGAGPPPGHSGRAHTEAAFICCRQRDGRRDDR
jgi:gamma-glutamyltranspeptidase/glutathione hydrolase